MVQALIEAFLTEVPELCESLSGAVQEGDTQVARRAAHTLKSCLKYVAPESDWSEAWKVEAAAEQGDLATVEKLAPAAIETAHRWVRRLELESS
jgi:two-component system, sensor histidine kinase and response regulator